MKRQLLFASILTACAINALADTPTDSITINETLGEVTVTAQRKYVRPTPRGLKISMTGNPLSKIGSAVDAIKQMPMIDASNGGITVLGKGAPLIYINGRRMRDSSELEMLTSEELRTVEIITNPSSKYGSDVSSVILIKTRGKDAGFYANGAASVTASEKWSESGQLNLNYHTENGVTIFGDISYGNNGFKQERDYKELFSTDGKLPLDHITRTFATAKQRRESLTADGGINYESGKNSVGVKYTYSRTPSSHFSYQAQSLTDLREPGEISSSNNLNSQSYRHYLNGYAELALPAGIGLRVDMDYITGKNTGRDFTSEIETGNMIENTNHTTSDLFAGRIELQKEFGKWELNAGTDYTYTDNDQRFNSLTSAGNQMLRPATDRVTQHLYSTYLSANLNLNEHWSLSTGIRYEDTHIRYLRNGIKESALSKGYNDLHPNFGITFSSPVTLSVFYKAVTYRPAYSSLDNNFVYVTPTLWETGNPELRSMKIAGDKHVAILQKIHAACQRHTLQTQNRYHLCFRPRHTFQYQLYCQSAILQQSPDCGNSKFRYKILASHLAGIALHAESEIRCARKEIHHPSISCHHQQPFRHSGRCLRIFVIPSARKR